MSNFPYSLQRANILGVHVSAINMYQALRAIDHWIVHREKYYVCVTPAHGVMECQTQPDLKQIFNSSGLTTPDGMAIVWLLKLMGYHHVSRVYGPDLMLAVCHRSQEMRYRHFLYGGNPNVPETLALNLQSRFPDLNIVGAYSPPFRPLTVEEDEKIIETINQVQPDVVWVGLSTPKQELWMAEHLGKINAPVMIGVGAAFDFLSGNKKQAPRWVQQIGLEWLFRLSTEPARLWRRYVQYPVFVLLVLGQLTGIKKYP